MNKILNPNKLKDIEEILKKSADEQLYFFLDDSIPHLGKDTIIFFDKNTSKKTTNGILADAIEFTSNMTDNLFYIKENDLKDIHLEYMKPYMPLLKHCYKPYLWKLTVSNLTETHLKLLSRLRKKGKCKASVNKTKLSIPATITLIIGNIHKTETVYLSEI